MKLKNIIKVLLISFPIIIPCITITKAESDYRITLNGKDFYYYMQSSGKNKYTEFYPNVSSWNHNSGYNKSFAGSGCSMYTASMIVSNVLGYPITPDQFMKDIGAKVNGSTYDLSNTGIYNRNGIPSVNKKVLAQKISDTYGLSWARVDINDKQEVDRYLSKGWLGYASWQHSKNGSKNDWYSGQMHFMAVREKIGDKYYCLTSSAGGSVSNAEQIMETGISYEEMKNTMRNTHEGIYFFGKTDISLGERSSFKQN